MKRRLQAAIVTGGAQGIGKAIAHRFLAEGYAVVIADTDAEAGAETVAGFSRPRRFRFMPCDVSREADVIRLVSGAVTAFGGIDVLVNNAAISHNTPVTELALADWNRVIGVNLTGPFLCARQAAPYLRQRKGAVINIASTRAFMSEPDTEAYSASKGGIVALTHALAASLAPEVRVNCISPGWIETADWLKRRAPKHHALKAADHRQHWSGRVGVPEDIASLAVYLASPRSGFITGSNFTVDGGMTRKMIYV